MEKMPYQPDLDGPTRNVADSINSDWRTALPESADRPRALPRLHPGHG